MLKKLTNKKLVSVALVAAIGLTGIGLNIKTQAKTITKLQKENEHLKKQLKQKPKVIIKYVSEKETIKKKIIVQCRKQGLDPKLALAIAKNESGFKHKVNERTGATGVFQLMPVICNCYTQNCSNMDSNITAGVAHLKALSKNFKDKRLVIAAFNAGGPSVMKYNGVPPYPETQQYVANVLATMKEFN